MTEILIITSIVAFFSFAILYDIYETEIPEPRELTQEKDHAYDIEQAKKREVFLANVRAEAQSEPKQTFHPA